MTRIKTLEDLKQLKEELKLQRELKKKASNSLVVVKVALATCGIASGAKKVRDFLVDQLEKRNIEAVVSQTGCMGYCYAEPTIEVTLPGQDPVVFGFVDTTRADEIIEKYIKNGELVDGIIPVNYQTIEN